MIGGQGPDVELILLMQVISFDVEVYAFKE